MSNPGPAASCFTTNWPGRVPILCTGVFIGSPFVPIVEPQPQLHQVNAIWDTGATKSCITQQVVDLAKLQPTGMTKVRGVHGEKFAETYLVAMLLPNGRGFPQLAVTKGDLGDGAQMLIGMDVIGCGDFAVTNFEGKTTMTFRMPSYERIDFSQQPPPKGTPVHNETPRPGRNDPCPCGSGKKYKKCCGASL